MPQLTDPLTGPNRLRQLVVVVVTLTVVTGTVPFVPWVSASGETTVSLSPTSSSTEPGSTTTVDVVVESADGGVRSYTFTVEVSDPSVASIENVVPKGQPRFEDVDYAGDDSSVTVTVSAADTADTGTVTIASIAVEGRAAGQTDLSLSVETLGDENNRPYTVTSSEGATITVETGSENSPPTADAGPDRTVDAGDVIELSATASDPDDESYTVSWTQLDGPDVTLRDADTLSPRAVVPTVDENTTATLRLSVTDPDGATATDTVGLTIIRNSAPGENSPPSVRAEAIGLPNFGNYYREAPGMTVELRAIGSDPDPGQTRNLSYAWTQVDGPDVELRNGDTPTPEFTTPQLSRFGRREIPRDVEFRAKVTDPDGATDTATVRVVVAPNEPPSGDDERIVVDDGYNITIHPMQDLDDVARRLTDRWTKVDGPDVDWGTTPRYGRLVLWVNTTEGTTNRTVTFELETTDPHGATNESTVSLTITPKPVAAEADAGPDRKVSPGSTIVINGSVRRSPRAGECEYSDFCRNANRYWTALEGAENVTFLNGTNLGTSRPTITVSKGAQVGSTVVLQLVAVSRPGVEPSSARDNVTLTVVNSSRIEPNDPPSVRAEAIGLPNFPSGYREAPGATVELRAIGSDPDPGQTRNLSYAWTQLDGPDAEVRESNTRRPEVLVPESVPEDNTKLRFRVTVTDPEGLTDTATVTLSIWGNTPPESRVVEKIVEANDTLRLSSRSDSDDVTGFEYEWTQTSGPTVELEVRDDGGFAVVTTPEVATNTTVTLENQRTDPHGATGTTRYVLTVTPRDIAPEADAGPNRTVRAGSTISINGTATHPNGEPVFVSWTHVSGPTVEWVEGTSALDPTIVIPEAADGAEIVLELSVIEKGLDRVPDYPDRDTVTLAVRDGGTDDDPPAVTIRRPENGTTFPAATDSVTINATYEDDGSGVNTSSVSMFVNDFDVTSEATVTAEYVTATIPLENVSRPRCLAISCGESYTVEVIVADEAGNTNTTTSTFEVRMAGLIEPFSATSPLDETQTTPDSLAGKLRVESFVAANTTVELLRSSSRNYSLAVTAPDDAEDVTVYLQERAISASGDVENLTMYIDGKERPFEFVESAGPGASSWVAFNVPHFSTRTVSFVSEPVDANATLVVNRSDPTAYQSIQDAIDSATDGDRIEVRPGTYRESVTIGKNITLIAPDGATLDGSTVSGPGIDLATEPASVVETASPVIGGFTITGYVTAIDAFGSDGAWTVRNVTIRNAVDTGVDAVRSTGDWTVQEGQITGAGVGIDASGSVGDWTVETVRIENTTSSSVDAFGTEGSWTIDTAVLENAAENGVYAENSTGDWRVHDVAIERTGFPSIHAEFSTGDWTVQNVAINDSASDAVFVEESTGDWTIEFVSIRNSTVGVDASGSVGDWIIKRAAIRNTTSSSVDAFGTEGSWTIDTAVLENAAENGVYAENSTGDWRVHDVAIERTGFPSIHAEFSTGDWTVQNVAINDSASTGVFLDSSTGDWTVRDATIANSSTDGVSAFNSTGDWMVLSSTIRAAPVGVDARTTTGAWVIRNSSVTNTRLFGLDAVDADQTGNATRNYWGAPDGPGGDFDGTGVEVVGSVAVLPFYTDANLTTLRRESDDTITPPPLPNTTDTTASPATSAGTPTGTPEALITSGNPRTEDPNGTDDQTTTDGQPGFTLLGTLAVILFLVAGRRRQP